MAAPQARTQLRRRPPGARDPASRRSRRAALRAFRRLRRLRLAAPGSGTSAGIQAAPVVRGADAHRQGHACADAAAAARRCLELPPPRAARSTLGAEEGANRRRLPRAQHQLHRGCAALRGAGAAGRLAGRAALAAAHCVERTQPRAADRSRSRRQCGRSGRARAGRSDRGGPRAARCSSRASTTCSSTCSRAATTRSRRSAHVDAARVSLAAVRCDAALSSRTTSSRSTASSTRRWSLAQSSC